MTHWESQLHPMPNEATNAGRILQGSVLNRPDVRVDSFDGHWVVQTREGPFPDELRAVTPRLARSLWWKKLDKERKTAPQWLEGEQPNEAFPVQENGVNYEIDLTAGYSQGLFLDQRLNREKLADIIQPGDRLLNCFAYTCSFSVVAARAGGVATSLDLSSSYLEWGKRNFHLNQLNPEEHYFCKGDVIEWLKRFARQGRSFRGVILDPPTFSRNRRKVFRAEKDFGLLVQLAAELVETSGGWILCSTNHHKLSPWQFETMLREGIDKSGRALNGISFTPMPPEFDEDDYLKSCWLDVE